MEPLSILPKNNETTFLSQNTRIIHQKYNSSGKINQTSDFDLQFVSIFERACYKNQECFSLITNDLDFKIILSLRLVSKAFSCFAYSYHFVSIKFAQLKNIILAINANYKNDFINQISNLKITLEINTFDEINQLVHFLLYSQQNNFFDNSLIVEFLKNIVRLDLLVGNGSETINKSNAQSLSELFAIVDHPTNYIFLPCLQCLSIGSIYNAELTFPQKLNNLKTLTIESITNGSCVIFPTSLDKLIILTFGTISGGCSVKLPTFLTSLTSFTIEYLGTILYLPKLPSLKQLSISSLSTASDEDEEYGCLQLSTRDALSHLEYFCIKKIDDCIPCDLSNYNFDNLETLVIGNIGWGVTFMCPKSLDNLRHFSMENIKSDTELILPDSMKNLESFSIGWIQNGATIKFPKVLENFQSLTIDEIDGDITLDLPDLLPKFTTLTINKVRGHAVIKLPDSVINLKSIFINDIFNNITFEFPSRMPNLTNLTINQISSDSTCKLPASMDKLENLTLGNIENNLLQLPDNLSCLISLTIAEISNNYKFPNFIPNLKNLSINKISRDVIFCLPESVKNLETLFIGDIFSCAKVILSCISNLQNLLINWIQFGAQLILPEVLPAIKNITVKDNNSFDINLPNDLNSLVNLSIGSLHPETKFRLPKSLNNLQSFSFESVHNEAFCNLICSLTNLKSLSIGKLSCNLKVPATIGNLTFFSIGNISEGVSLELPGSLESLESLTIGTLGKNAKLTLPPVLKNLQYLNIETIDDRLLSHLGYLPKLTDFVIQEIYYTNSFQYSGYYNVLFELPESWVSLKSCTIYKIACKGTISHVDIVLPNTLKKLVKLTIQTIDKRATLRIRPTDLFDNLATLIVGNINDGAELIVSDALDQLTTLKLGSIEATASISLPETLNQLQILSIRFFGSQEKLIKRFKKFPETLPNLSQLIIDGSPVNLKMPTLINGRKMFTAENQNVETIDFINEINQKI